MLSFSGSKLFVSASESLFPSSVFMSSNLIGTADSFAESSSAELFCLLLFSKFFDKEVSSTFYEEKNLISFEGHNYQNVICTWYGTCKCSLAYCLERTSGFGDTSAKTPMTLACGRTIEKEGLQEAEYVVLSLI